MSPHNDDLFSPALLRTLKSVTAALRRARVRHAVGGSLAMAAHGYRRETTDIDVFIDAKQKPAAMRAIRKLGWPTASVFRGFHHIAEIPGFDIDDLRVDLLFPADDPDWSAVQAPERVHIGSVQFDAFPLLLLILAKVQAVSDMGEEGDKHLGDLKELWRRGLIEEVPLIKLARRSRMLTETVRVLKKIQ